MIPTSPVSLVSPIRHSAPATAFIVVAWSLLTLWVFAWLLGPAVVSLLDLSLNPQGHAPLHAHGHPFVDARSWWGVPNTLDVLSNLPLVFAGAAGFWCLPGGALAQSTSHALQVFFAGLIALYALAKLLELGDEAVFRATGEWVSGHSLKHVAAACAALPIFSAVRRREPGDNAPVHPAAMG
ncbi:hypothetical protein [Hydrogenophaga sp. PBL-H3]|uniref:hypothetical protein n=1 Tax=Hydrogenophaga sp. PBL-H3 TaxID=434010 RepID=UPI001320477E|nr:hypothetical protein [Hydrogenophaga sp. PBL-H3]QHE77973.1 hypothetical protein F9Z45_19035 [Hydrogenophaga sp. PBL-H3]QHE82398.1 hypothetical protein F9Z44_19035 [Hydrogenophaga sp. PBL-H3]